MEDRDDDDDFQDPISLTRSSLRVVANTPPLRSCNAARQKGKKKSRLVSSSCKENRELYQFSDNPPHTSHASRALHKDLDSRILAMGLTRYTGVSVCNTATGLTLWQPFLFYYRIY
jgi:hypothetical protein